MEVNSGGTAPDASGQTFTASGTLTAASGAKSTDNVGTGGIAYDIQDILLGADGVTVDISTENTLTRNLTGIGGLTKSGSGTLILGGVNTYTGATTVSAGGTLQAGAANTIQNSGAVIVNGTFALNGYDQTIKNLSGTGAITLGGATLTVNQSRDGAFSGVISGTGTLTKTGAGALTLSGNANSVSSVTVAGGALNLSGGLLTSGILIRDAAAFNITGASATLTVNGLVDVESGGTFDLTKHPGLLDIGQSSSLRNAGTVRLSNPPCRRPDC
ncbi:MAG: autotransporter-associated beta strand repeat-containing protein [Candidatus Accumulibacter sp.]|nr:autotransporter-associated beta strand repeat-containing protein [Accumulibacter sp.]